MLLLWIVAIPAFAAEASSETDIEAALRLSLQPGKLVELKAAAGTFVGIETPAQPDQLKGAVLLLHDSTANPDDPRLMHDLRTLLPQHGWTTLAIQLPVVSPDQPFEAHLKQLPDANERIAAAQTWLQSRNPPVIALLGHGLGAIEALQQLATQGESTPWGALITLSLPVPKTDLETAQTLTLLPKVKKPLLDVSGSLDWPMVVETAPERRATALEAGLNYRQEVLTGADHQFTGLHPTLAQLINGWLTQTLQKQ